jgi:predicted transcriptional regulator
MAVASHRNFHVPLPDETYRALRSEADRRRRPATALVREAVEDWLERRRAETLHAAIAGYAARHAGTPADLDPALEAAGIDALIEKPRKSRRTCRKATIR